MNNVKKIITGILALNMLLAVPVFAEVPKGTVVISGKAYSLAYANQSENNKEILSVIKNNEYGTIFIKGTNGKWYDNNTGNEIDKNLIPSVIYKDAEGNMTAYAAEDGVEIPFEDLAFRVENAGFISKNQVRIEFSHLLKASSIKSFIKIAGKELSEEDKITVLEDGYTAIIDLAVGINEGNTETSISVSKDVQAFDGETLFKEFKRDILVLNSKDKVFSSEDEINSDVNILTEGLTFEKTKVNGTITVYGDNVTLSNVSGKNIIISSGSQKSIELDGEFNDDIILEGSTKLKASNGAVIKNVIIRSKDSKAEITLDGIFEQVSVESAIGAIHMAKNAEIGTLVINEEVDVQGDSSNRICQISSENSELQGSVYGDIHNGGELSNNQAPIYGHGYRPTQKKDTEKPVISLSGSEEVELEVGESYVDAGATAEDNKDGDITKNIVMIITDNKGNRVDEVDTTAVGKFTIHYNVSDKAGNTADEVTRTVIVKPIVTVQIFNEDILSAELKSSFNDSYSQIAEVAIKATIESYVQLQYNCTITIYDNQDRIVYNWEAVFEDNEALIQTTPLQIGDYKMVINPGLMGNKHTFEFEIK